MNALERFTYASGRAVGAALREFLDTMWPAQDSRVREAEKMTPDIATIPVPPRDDPAWQWKPVVNDGSQSIDPRWSPQLGDTGKGYFQITRGEFTDAEKCHPATEVFAPQPDTDDWFEWAPARIAAVLESGQWVPVEWIDTVSNIVSEMLAADPAKAVAALWNYQLSRNETT